MGFGFASTHPTDRWIVAILASMAIRDAIEYRACPLVRSVRVLQRHHVAVALADEHAGADVDGRAVADDDARVLAGGAGGGAVVPDDGVAGKSADAAVVAGDEAAFALAGI